MKLYLDQFRLIFLILASYPVGLLNYKLKNATMRLWYGLITGVILQYFMYGWDLIHLVIDTSITYLFMKFLGRKVSAFWILALTIFHLSGFHIKSMIEHYGENLLDFSCIYLMSICKFSQIAFSYEDGDKKDEEIKSSYHRSKYLFKINI